MPGSYTIKVSGLKSLKQQLRPSEARMIGVAPISVVFQTTALLLELHPGEDGGTGGLHGYPGTMVPTIPTVSTPKSLGIVLKETLNDMALTSDSF